MGPEERKSVVNFLCFVLRGCAASFHFRSRARDRWKKKEKKEEEIVSENRGSRRKRVISSAREFVQFLASLTIRPNYTSRSPSLGQLPPQSFINLRNPFHFHCLSLSLSLSLSPPSPLEEAGFVPFLLLLLWEGNLFKVNFDEWPITTLPSSRGNNTQSRAGSGPDRSERGRSSIPWTRNVQTFFSFFPFLVHVNAFTATMRGTILVFVALLVVVCATEVNHCGTGE